MRTCANFSSSDALLRHHNSGSKSLFHRITWRPGFTSGAHDADQARRTHGARLALGPARSARATHIAWRPGSARSTLRPVDTGYPRQAPHAREPRRTLRPLRPGLAFASGPPRFASCPRNSIDTREPHRSLGTRPALGSHQPRRPRRSSVTIQTRPSPQTLLSCLASRSYGPKCAVEWRHMQAIRYRQAKFDGVGNLRPRPSQKTYPRWPTKPVGPVTPGKPLLLIRSRTRMAL